MLFEVAIIKKPTKKEQDEGTATETLIMPPTAVVARDASAAAIAAVTKDGGLKDFDSDRCEVLVRPFGQA